MIKQICKSLIAAFIFLGTTNVSAATLNGYTIDRYDVNISVNENNTLDITENITTNFEYDKHGIIRDIPLKNKIYREDGTTSVNRCKISNIDVSDMFSVTKKSDVATIKIGSPDYTVTGKQDYTIKYTYDLGKDTGKTYDEFYFNIIGDSWDTTVSDITFKIDMPKEFDKSKIGFTYGPNGSSNTDNTHYEVINNSIVGYFSGALEPNWALTIRVELPEGYFINTSNNLDIGTILSFITPIFLLIISYLIWLKLGKDKKIYPTVEFYPPENINSAQLGYIYKGKVVNEDITSLVVYLASKGYLKITELEPQGLFKSDTYKITKLKEYDGNNSIEKIFFDGLFASGNSVSEHDLKYSFYETIKCLSEYIDSPKNRSSLFCKGRTGSKLLLYLFAVISYIAISFKPIVEHASLSIFLVGLIFPLIALFVFIKLFSKGASLYNKIFILLWSAFFGGMPFIGFVLPAIVQNSYYIFAYIIGIICIILILVLTKYFNKKTNYGLEIYGKILGFKNFLETAEKDRIEMLVLDNPSYFYDILPYAYVLGISNKWIDKFETISLEPATWYEGYNNRNSTVTCLHIISTINSIGKDMSSTPNTNLNSGSGFSGGGFSGGGSGGGGGSSW